MKKVLVVASTHGHERIGLKVIEELVKLKIDKTSLRLEIGNPMASEKNIPYLESDLNRIFPGKKDGNYEERRADQLQSIIEDFDIVIDVHSTKTTDLGDDSMLIVTKINSETQEIIDTIKPPKVLLMKYKSDNALISAAKAGIAFEYGMDDSHDVLQATLFDIVEILIFSGIIKNNPYSNPRIYKKTKIYDVYAAFEKDFVGGYTLDAAMENFSLCKKGQIVCTSESGENVYSREDFYPILFGNNRYTNILGFKSKLIV